MLLGNGTTLQSIIDNIENGNLNARINLVISDNPNAFALKRAENHNIPTYIINNKTSEEIDVELYNVLKNYNIDLIVLVGYLKLIGNRLINNYTIINTHPSLLPKFGGKGMYGMNVHTAVVAAQEEFSGPTVHFVNCNYDEGNIISQTKVKLDKNETPESLSAKVQAAEKIQLINVLQNFINIYDKIKNLYYIKKASKKLAR